jgi:hypothetical protein
MMHDGVPNGIALTKTTLPYRRVVLVNRIKRRTIGYDAISLFLREVERELPMDKYQIYDWHPLGWVVLNHRNRLFVQKNYWGP